MGHQPPTLPKSQVHPGLHRNNGCYKDLHEARLLDYSSSTNGLGPVGTFDFPRPTHFGLHGLLPRRHLRRLRPPPAAAAGAAVHGLSGAAGSAAWGAGGVGCDASLGLCGSVISCCFLDGFGLLMLLIKELNKCLDSNGISMIF